MINFKDSNTKKLDKQAIEEMINKEQAEAAVYVRVAHLSATSIDAIHSQFEKCVFKAQQLGYDTTQVKIYIDIAAGNSDLISGPSDLNKLLKDLKKGIVKTVICTSFDRLGRDVATKVSIYEQMQAYNVDLVFTDMDDFGDAWLENKLCVLGCGEEEQSYSCSSMWKPLMEKLYGEIAIYVRTARASGRDLDKQIAACLHEALSLGYSLEEVKLYCEKDILGLDMNAWPEMTKLREDARNGKVKMLISTHPDRFGRSSENNVAICHEFYKNDIKLMFTNTDFNSSGEKNEFLSMLNAMTKYGLTLNK